MKSFMNTKSKTTLLIGGLVQRVVAGLEGLRAAAGGGARDVGAVAQEVVVELGQVLVERVVLPVGAGLAFGEGKSGVRRGLPYKN